MRPPVQRMGERPRATSSLELASYDSSHAVGQFTERLLPPEPVEENSPSGCSFDVVCGVLSCVAGTAFLVGSLSMGQSQFAVAGGAFALGGGGGAAAGRCTARGVIGRVKRLNDQLRESNKQIREVVDRKLLPVIAELGPNVEEAKRFAFTQVRQLQAYQEAEKAAGRDTENILGSLSQRLHEFVDMQEKVLKAVGEVSSQEQEFSKYFAHAQQLQLGLGKQNKRLSQAGHESRYALGGAVARLERMREGLQHASKALGEVGETLKSVQLTERKILEQRREIATAMEALRDASKDADVRGDAARQVRELLEKQQQELSAQFASFEKEKRRIKPLIGLVKEAVRKQPKNEGNTVVLKLYDQLNAWVRNLPDQSTAQDDSATESESAGSEEEKSDG